MANSPPRRCNGDPRCPHPALPGGLCPDHRAARRQASDQRRNPKRARSLGVYRSTAWRRLSSRILRERPYCQWTDEPCHAPSTEVDHIQRIEDNGDPWDETNLQALCHRHHSRKTAIETGFGGRRD